MRYHALAVDYDGTLAHHGLVDQPTLDALRRFRDSGRKLLMVTGRELPDLQKVFPHLDLFDRVIAENGALLYHPATRKEKVLGQAPPHGFVEQLQRRNVQPLSVGRVIVATWEPHQVQVLEAIHDCGLELQLIFNKGAIMVLPTGVNKATGLQTALGELGLSLHNVVGVGDAENDHAFLEHCEFSVAVANGLGSLKAHVDWITSGSQGQGVQELIEQLLQNDLQARSASVSRHHLEIGTDQEDRPVKFPPYGHNFLVAGTSGGGKSTLVTAFFEQLCKHGYQTCILDPEGDYSELEQPMLLGNTDRPASVEEIAKALEHPNENVVANLVGIPLQDRPAFLQKLLPRLQELRSRTGRPHWIMVDEAHHVLPTDLQSAQLVLPALAHNYLFVTVNPNRLLPAVLAKVDTLLAIGEAPENTIREFCETVAIAAPPMEPVRLHKGEVLAWQRSNGAPFWFRATPPQGTRRRHIRKYAQGELAPDLSFYFTGPEQKLRLRAQNLEMFLQLADGVDDETWLHHLRQGDYSEWFRREIKDEELAAAAERIERDESLTPEQSRAQIREHIEQRYTAPA